MAQALAFIYASMIAGVIGFQIALIAGAPWGRLTQGGQHERALPLSGRIAAALSIVVLVGMALGVLSQAGEWPNWPRWTGWVAVVIQSVSTLANWATRSASERKLWAPITTILLALALAVLLVE